MTASASPGADPDTLSHARVVMGLGAGKPVPVLEGIEQNPAAIEHALYQLNRTIAQCGVLFSVEQAEVWPFGMPQTEAGRMIVNPVSQACQDAQYRLLQHLTKVVGVEAAMLTHSKVQRRVFEEIERPLIDALHTSH